MDINSLDWSIKTSSRMLGRDEYFSSKFPLQAEVLFTEVIKSISFCTTRDNNIINSLRAIGILYTQDHGKQIQINTTLIQGLTSIPHRW